MKELLVIAYAFPPCSVTGTYRTLAFVKYLEPLGWHSTVLCAENPIYPERDERLLAEIPASTRVIRTRDVDWLSRLQRLSRWGRPAAGNGSEESGLSRAEKNQLNSWRLLKRSLALRLRPTGRCPGWFLPTLRAGRRVLRSQGASAIYSSGPPWTAHLVAARLQREFGIPWIADFRDPWVGNPFVSHEGQEKRDKADEATVVKRADRVTCVLDSMRDDFLTRYPSVKPEKIITLANGFDPASFVGIDSGNSAEVGKSTAPLTIVHAGQVYGRRRIEPVLAGVTEWFRAEPAMAASVRLHLLGGGAAHVAELRGKVAAARTGDSVIVEPEIPHDDALVRLARATVLLLIGFSGRGEQYQMSGKIYEYLALRRPILALAPSASPVGDILRATGVRHWIVSPDDSAGLLNALRSIGEAWRRGELVGPQSVSSLAAYDRREQAVELSQVLDGAASAGKRG